MIDFNGVLEGMGLHRAGEYVEDMNHDEDTLWPLLKSSWYGSQCLSWLRINSI